MCSNLHTAPYSFVFFCVGFSFFLFSPHGLWKAAHIEFSLQLKQLLNFESLVFKTQQTSIYRFCINFFLTSVIFSKAEVKSMCIALSGQELSRSSTVDTSEDFIYCLHCLRPLFCTGDCRACAGFGLFCLSNDSIRLLRETSVTSSNLFLSFCSRGHYLPMEVVTFHNNFYVVQQNEWPLGNTS